MLKISVIGDWDKAIEFALEGKLVSPRVDELARLSQEALFEEKSWHASFASTNMVMQAY